ncbi:MAG: hypothetical protein AAGF97_04190 [Planctomycetota bacterium]
MAKRLLNSLFAGGLILAWGSLLWADPEPGVDFAQLMPESTLVYVELQEPANHVEQLVSAMGLMGPREERDEEAVTIHLDDGFVLSSDFRISPSLLAEMKRVRGAAISLSAPFKNHEPVPLVVVDPGKSSLLRGLMETGIQVVPKAEAIGGYATYHHAEGNFWCVQTKTLFVASSDRDHLEEAIQRARGRASSLVDNETFAKRRRECKDALLFAYADGPNIVEHVVPQVGGDVAIARAVLDLDHLQCATAMISSTDSGAKAELRISMDENHNSLAYGMIRTVPFRQDIFRNVPGSAALVAAIGVNPPLKIEGASSQHITAMDIGREFFANLSEVAMFVLPSIASPQQEAPNFGFVVKANDAEKSESLWSQLLALPAMVGSDDGPRVEEIRVDGRSGHRYVFDDDDIPEMEMVRLDDATMVFGTEDAVAAVLNLDGRKDSILNDEGLADAIKDAPAHASKAIFAQVGRMAQLAAQIEKGSDAQQLAMISQVLKHTKVVVVSDEAPDQLTVQVEASELPVFEDVIRMVAEMQGSQAPQGAVVHVE